LQQAHVAPIDSKGRGGIKRTSANHRREIQCQRSGGIVHRSYRLARRNKQSYAANGTSKNQAREVFHSSLVKNITKEKMNKITNRFAT
jgi:hypothetical protein